MSLFGKSAPKTEELNGKNKIQQGPEAHNHIGVGTYMKGELNAPGLLRVDGTIIGDVNCDTKVVFGPQALLEGTLTAQNAEIAGEVKGKLIVKEVLTLKSTAKLQGEIQYGQIQAEKGAIMNGQIKQTDAEMSVVQGTAVSKEV